MSQNWDESFLFKKLKEMSANFMSMKEIPYKIYLTEDKTPKAWYNLGADIKDKPPPLVRAYCLKEKLQTPAKID